MHGGDSIARLYSYALGGFGNDVFQMNQEVVAGGHGYDGPVAATSRPEPRISMSLYPDAGAVARELARQTAPVYSFVFSVSP